MDLHRVRVRPGRDLMWAKRIALDDQTWLVIEASGMAGAHALACALGLRTLPAIQQALDRAEWIDILAKSRGMALAGTLTRFPVVRQFCGCRVEYTDADGELGPHCKLIVRMCPGHGAGPEDHSVIGRTERRHR